MTRHRVPVAGGAAFLDAARIALDSLSARPGFTQGGAARAIDDPEVWLVTTQWRDVGSYRRAMRSFEVRMAAVALLATAVDEPTAFEWLDHREPGIRSHRPLAEPSTSLVADAAPSSTRGGGAAPSSTRGGGAAPSSTRGGGAAPRSARAADADTVGIGETAAARVATDLDPLEDASG